jgi:hypothetical protein
MTCFPITDETLWAPRFFNIKFINNLSGIIFLQFGVSKPFWSSIFYPDTFILVRTNLNVDEFGAHQTEGNIYRFDLVYSTPTYFSAHQNGDYRGKFGGKSLETRAIT